MTLGRLGGFRPSMSQLKNVHVRQVIGCDEVSRLLIWNLGVLFMRSASFLKKKCILRIFIFIFY